MMTRFISRFLTVIAIPVLAGYAFFMSTSDPRDYSQPNLKAAGEEAQAWIFQQRAYPLKSLPGGVTETAWRVSMGAVAPASNLTNDLTDADQWTSIGPAPVVGGQIVGSTANPRVTGRIADIVVDPTQRATHWFIAAAGGGIWETADAGQTWIPKTDAEMSLVTPTVTISPSNPQILFAGVQDVSGVGVGLLKSTNGGATWVPQDPSVFVSQEHFYIAAVRVHPTDPNTVMAVTGRGPTATPSPQPEGGVYKSTNGGTNFVRTLVGPGTALEFNPMNFNQQYAAVRNAPFFSFGAGNNGIYRSLDGGNSWAPMIGPWKTGNNAVDAIAHAGAAVKIAVAPSNPSTVYVVVPPSSAESIPGGIWKTQNAWDLSPSWTLVPPALGGSTYIDVALVDPLNANIFYAGGGGESPDPSTFALQRLNANGTWTLIVSSTHVDQHALAAFVVSTRTGDITQLLLGNDGGFWTSTNQGATWTNKNSNLGVIQFYAGSQHPTDASAALGGSQDNGTELWSGSVAWNWKFGGDGGHSAFSKSDPTTWLVSAQYLDVYKATGSGSSFLWAQTGLDRNGAGSIAPIRRSPSNDFLLAGSRKLSKSKTFFLAGDTPEWFSVTPDMGIDVSAIGFAPSDVSSQTYAFGAGGIMWRTTDDATHWYDMDPLGQVPNRYVKAIAFHPTNPAIIYVALSGLDQHTPGQPGHVFKTMNGTSPSPTWTNVSPGPPGQPVNLPMNALAIDPTDPNKIYVGADLGVWKSTNAGSSWTFMGPAIGMPNVPVFDLLFSPVDGRLVAYTYGRGAFKLNAGSSQPITPPRALSVGAR